LAALKRSQRLPFGQLDAFPARLSRQKATAFKLQIQSNSRLYGFSPVFPWLIFSYQHNHFVDTVTDYDTTKAMIKNFKHKGFAQL
jgi:hypothetical protein